jgi:hypothetical protein
MAKMENHPGQLEREMNVTWLIIAKAGITIACSLTHSYGETCSVNLYRVLIELHFNDVIRIFFLLRKVKQFFSLCIMIAWDRGSHLRFSNGCNLIFMF